MTSKKEGYSLPAKSFLQRLEALGHGFFYLTLLVAGHLGAYVLLVPVVFFYVLCSRNIHKSTSFYLQKRFPGSGLFQRWLATFKLVHSFGCILIDRAWLGMKKGATLQGKSEGMESLIDVLSKKQGLILLTAHVGNWQTALSHIGLLPVRIHSLMHYDVEAVPKHFFDLKRRERPFNIINTNGFMGGMVEAAAALQRGEVVTIMGDRLNNDQSIEIDFLGIPTCFPISAHALAASTGASVGVVFAAKTSRTTYDLKVWQVSQPQYTDRETRNVALKKSVQFFVDSLEEYLIEHPYQWYNFYDFWMSKEK